MRRRGWRIIRDKLKELFLWIRGSIGTKIGAASRFSLCHCYLVFSGLDSEF